MNECSPTPAWCCSCSVHASTQTHRLHGWQQADLCDWSTKKSIKFRRPNQTFPIVIHCPSPSRNFCSLHIWKASSKWFIHSTILNKCSLRARHWIGNWKGSDGALALGWSLTTVLGHPRSPFQCSIFIMILPRRHFRTSQNDLRDVIGQTPSP